MWTMDNTEGFTQAELDTINAALEALAARFESVEPSNLNDLITNAWTDGATTKALIVRVSKRLA